MNINSNTVSNQHESNGMDTIPYVSCICSTHKPIGINMNYHDYFNWIDKKRRYRAKQKQCPICKHWVFEEEF